MTLLVLKHIKDVNLIRRDHTNQSLFHVAVEDRKNIEIVRELIRSGVDVNAFDDDGQTPVFLADDNNLDILNLLVEARVDLNHKRKSDGMSPLMAAIQDMKNA